MHSRRLFSYFPIIIAVIALLLLTVSLSARAQRQSQSNLAPASTTSTLDPSSIFLNEVDWSTFSDSDVGVSLEFPANWFVERDPAFRKPVAVSGTFERLVVFSSEVDPLYGDESSNNLCRVDVFVNDVRSAVLPVLGHQAGSVLSETTRVSDAGMFIYSRTFDMTEIGHHNHEELYIPYDNGTIAFVSWSSDKATSGQCSAVFSKMSRSVKVQQSSAPPKTQRAVGLATISMPRILQLPFSGVETIQQGWKYTYTDTAHLGIDYIEGIINRSNTWRNFDVLAAAEGDATYLGHKTGWGHTVLVKHTINGQLYYTVYAHLEAWDVPGNDTWQHVDPRQKIGTAGKSGSASNNVIHLHFEVSSNGYGKGSDRLDPYDLRTYRKYYPGGDKYSGLGIHHSWMYEPPVADVGITLFEDPNYQGSSLTLTDEDLDLCNNPLDPAQPAVIPCFTASSWTDVASSVKVAPGWHARLHKHNIADAIYWGDDASQGVNSNQDIPDFGLQTFPDGTALDNNVSRIYVWRCGESISSLFKVASGSATDDPCVPPPVSPADLANFVTDLTLPDGAVVLPGQSLIKTWRLRNTGTTTWGSGYQLVFVNSEQMNAPSPVSVPATAPGGTADVSINFTAPSSPGEHIGYWRLRNPQGTYFGPTIWVKISVQSPSGYLTLFTADPSSPANASQVRIHARAGSMPNFRALRLKIDGNVVYEIGAPEFYFDWNTSGYASGAHNLVLEAADQTDTAWSHPQRRSMAYTLLGTSGSNNHAPNRPNPSSPYDWYVYYSGNTAQLCAQANGDPDGDPLTYYFDIYQGAQTWNSGWTTNSCVTTSALGPYDYQWRVKVRDNHSAESEWSESWHFTLVNPSLSISELYFQPQDTNSEQVKIRTCTTGQGGIGITMRVSVNDANDGSGNGIWHIIKEQGSPCFNDVDAPIWNTLEYGDGPHRVRSEAHGLQTGWNGAAVREEVYTLPHRRPAGTRLLAPVPLSGNIREAIYLNARTVSFQWQPTLRASSYTLHVGTNPSPKDNPNPIFRQTFGSSSTGTTVTFDQDFPTLYWQVSTSNDVGSNASGDQLFGIDRTAPACGVQPLAPVLYENVFQVTWSGTDNLSGIRTFDLQYLDSGRGAWSDWLTVPLTKTYELFTGQPGHTYSFRCRATDQANNQGVYPTGADTSTRIDPAARPPAPWWNTAYAGKRNLTILNNMAGVALPAGYPVHLHFDTGTNPTAAEIYNASQTSTKCDDVRVIYSDATELNRLVFNCTPSVIDIWFRTQVSLSGGTSNNTSHQLYYGNVNAGSPPADVSQVWYPYREGDTSNLYLFQEGSGAATYDYSNNGRNCTLNPTVQWAASKWGNGLHFSRANNGDTVSLTCGSPYPLSAFTVEFWYKPDQDTDGRITGQLGPSGQLSWLFSIESDRMKFERWCNGCGGQARGNINFRNQPYYSQWNYLALTYDGSRVVKFYVNGNLDNAVTLDGSGLGTYNIPLEIGSVEGIGQGKYSIGAYRLSKSVKTSFDAGALAMITTEPSTAAGSSIAPPATGLPNLAILDLSTQPAQEGGVIVQAVIRNNGTRGTENGFYTDLYLNHLPIGVGDYTGSLRFWVNDPIAAGATVTLTTVITDLASLGGLAIRSLSPLSESTGTLYAQVDSTGSVSETDNVDNIYSTGAEACVATADIYEEDDSVTMAQPFVLGQIQRHNFSGLLDRDWTAFTAQGGMTYTVRTLNLGPAADTYLYLYDTNGATLLASNDDAGESLASQIDWTAPLTGTYYALVQHWNPSAGGCGTTYDLSVARAGTNKVYLPLVRR